MARFCALPILLLVLIATALDQRYSVSANEERKLPMPKPRLDGRIIGGDALDITFAPYQVSVQRGRHFCGGSIINNKYVLTAAHCTDGQKAQFLTVRVGSTNNDRNGPNGALIEVEEIKQHKLYNISNIDYDFSLLKLVRPLVFNNSVEPVKLPYIWNKLRDGTDCLVTGWGNTRNASQPRNSLRGVVVPIVNSEECNQDYALYGGITKRMICAGYTAGGKDACQGDSGGPLVCNGIQYGIVSWGFGCAEPKFPGIYSNVYEMRNWIKFHSKF